MPSEKVAAKRNRSVLVQVETPNLIPERDLGEIPVLQAEHQGIDFGTTEQRRQHADGL